METNELIEWLEKLKRLDDARVSSIGVGEPIHQSEEEFLSELIKAYPLLLSQASRIPALEAEVAAKDAQIKSLSEATQTILQELREANGLVVSLRSQLAASQEREGRMREALKNLLFAHENADETGYVTDVGFLDVDTICSVAHELTDEALSLPSDVGSVTDTQIVDWLEKNKGRFECTSDSSDFVIFLPASRGSGPMSPLLNQTIRQAVRGEISRGETSTD